MRERIEHEIIDGIECKHCSKCGEWKPLSEFSKDERNWDGLQCGCKECHNKTNKRWRDENPEYYEKYYEKNKEKIDEYQQNWREVNKEWLKEYNQKRYEENKEEINKSNNLRAKLYRMNSIVGRANALRNSYIYSDRKANRIGDVLPEDYVTLQDVIRLIAKKCAHFDECGTYGWRKIGLNRLDNSLPHIKSNVEPCCCECNKKEYKKTVAITVYQYTLDKELIEIYPSIREAARQTNSFDIGIRLCCKGVFKQYKDFIWSYEPL